MDKNNPSITKEPWLAVLLSSILAGAGQIYSGRMLRGCCLIFIQAVLFYAALWQVFSFTGNILVGVRFFLLFVVIKVWNLFDAHKCARKGNTEDFEISRKQNKDPWLGVFLSDLLPGLGQIYIKKWLSGIIFIACFVALLTLRRTYPLFFYALWAVLSALVCYHAYMSSPVRRETSKKVILIIAVIVLGLKLLDYMVFPFREYFVEAYQIPKKPEWYPEELQTSVAMSPALITNDRILVRKSATYTPKRGDIIVFKSPEDPEIPYVMRLIAFEGESVEIKNKIIHLNAKKIQSPIIQNIKYASMGKFELEGELYIVPKGSVFVLGDNSNNSRDSRFYGAIPKGDIIGKAYKIYWPLERIGPVE